MADSQNVRINITAEDQATPAFDRIIAGLQRLEQAGEQNAAWVTQLSTLLGSQQQAAQATTQSTNQLATSYLAMAQAIRDQTQGYTQAQAATLAYRQEQDKLREATRQAKEEATAAAVPWKQLLTVAAGLGISTGLTALISQLRQAVVESVNLAAKMQDLNLAFRAIEGSTAAANRTLGMLFDTSQRLGVNFVEAAEGFKRLDQAARGTALEGQGIQQVFTNLLSGARVLGVSSQQAQQAIVALEQILTKGKLSAEEYRRQLGNAIPGALKLMADGLGVSTQALEQMIAQGIIPAQAAVVAFGKAMGDLGGQQGQGAVERLTSTFAQLKNETAAWMASIGSGIGTAIQPFLQGLIQISAQLRTLFGIRPPGQQSQPGANQGGLGSTFFPGPLTPETLGLPVPGTTGPTELPEPGFISSRYDALIREEAARAGIDPGLFSRLIKEESSFNPRATGPFIPGQGNARGLGQIMPATGADYGLTSITDFYDPQKNIPASANILRDYTARLKKDFGDLDDLTRIALAAYNAGIGNVEKAIRETIAIGEKVTAGQVIGRLPQPLVTGTYVQHIAGGIPRSDLQPPAGGAAATGGPTVDPVASMLLTVGKAVDETLTGITAFQKKMDDLNAKGLDFAGVLGKDITDGADEVVKKFTQAGNLLITFPGLLARMSSQQRELVSLAAQQVAAFQQRVQDETQSGAQAQKRVQELRAAEQLQEALTAADVKAQEQAITTLQRLSAAYTQTKEARDEDTAAQLKAQFPQNEALQQAADTVIALAATRAAYKEEVAALEDKFVALQQATTATREAEEAQRAFQARVQGTIEQLQAPRDEQAVTQLRTLAARHGVTFAPEDQAAVTAAEQIRAQAREMEQITQRLAGNMRQTFDTLWEQVFTGGVTSFRQLGQVVVQSLQKMFAQVTSQIMNLLLNAATGTTGEKGGWEGALARGIVGIGTAAIGGGTGGGTGGEAPGLEALFGTGGIAPQGFGSIRSLAGGGVVARPSLATLAELGTPEAVVPLSGGRAIPVEMRGASAPPHPPIVIELHQSYEGAYDPRLHKTSKREVLAWVIDDYRADGPIRRTFRAG